MNKDELYKCIIDSCNDWMPLEDIASSVERKYDYLLNYIIPTMLNEGLLERMQPDAPRYPNQKYKKKGQLVDKHRVRWSVHETFSGDIDAVGPSL